MSINMIFFQVLLGTDSLKILEVVWDICPLRLMWIIVNNNQNNFTGLEFIKFTIFGKKNYGSIFLEG